MKSKKKTIVIPKGIYEIIDALDLTNTYKKKAAHLVERLIRMSNQYNDEPCGKIGLARTTLRANYGTDYYKFLNELKKSNIIIDHKSYSTSTGACKDYSINKAFYYKTNDVVEVEVKEKVLEEHISTTWYSEVCKFRDCLKTPTTSLQVRLDKELQNISIENLVLNENIKQGVYPIKVKGKRIYYRNLNHALKQVEGKSMDAILCNQKLYIDSVDSFVNSKKLDIKINYLTAIHNFNNKLMYARRNNTNNRLDTNFTNMPKALFNEIAAENDLYELDVKASQPTLLANIAGRRIDPLFFDDVMDGKLYEEMQKMYNCDRDGAKGHFMKIAFSTSKYRSSLSNCNREVFSKKYCGIMDFISKYNSNELPIQLQKTEAKLIIDKVLATIYKMGIVAISKHDSIICHSKDAEVINSIMINETKGFKINFKGHYIKTGVIHEFNNYL